MPDGTPAQLLIKEVSSDGDNGIEVTCQGSAAGLAGILIGAMDHPVIKFSILTAVGVYFNKQGKELESLIIGKEVFELHDAFSDKIMEAQKSGE